MATQWGEDHGELHGSIDDPRAVLKMAHSMVPGHSHIRQQSVATVWIFTETSEDKASLDSRLAKLYSCGYFSKQYLFNIYPTHHFW
ncbi:MAG: hypothetical protein ACXVMS_16770 [Flavisolibacter sp.]